MARRSSAGWCSFRSRVHDWLPDGTEQTVQVIRQDGLLDSTGGSLVPAGANVLVAQKKSRTCIRSGEISLRCCAAGQSKSDTGFRQDGVQTRLSSGPSLQSSGFPKDSTWWPNP